MTQACGLPGRPVVCAAVIGLLCSPLTLPLAAAICGSEISIDPVALAARAALFGACPALIALAMRRRPSTRVVAMRPLLRGLMLLTMAPALLAAGPTLRHAVLNLGGEA